MAEAILHHLGGERFDAYSAGSQPAGFIHQLAIDALNRIGIPILFAESKSWDCYEGERFDAVVTLCDSAALEECPSWSGSPLKSHWGLPDPAMHPGSIQERMELAVTIANRLKAKIEGLIAMDFSANKAQLQAELDRLGQI